MALRACEDIEKPPITGEQVRTDDASRTAEQTSQPPHANAHPEDLSTSSVVQNPDTRAGRYLLSDVSARGQCAYLEISLCMYASGVRRASVGCVLFGK
jgi:hypothetical protein